MTIAVILDGKGRNVVSVAPDATIAEVVTRLREHRIGAVLVLDPITSGYDIHERHILGIISERDVIHSLAASPGAGDVLDLIASHLMTEVRNTVTPSASLADAALLMTERRVRHLPVLDQELLVGLVSIGDVVKAGLMQQAHKVQSLRAYASSQH